MEDRCVKNFRIVWANYCKMAREADAAEARGDEAISAAFEQKGRVAILNFASYKNPGGMFLNGSIAQEEALCHASNGVLFEVLSSEKVFDAFYEQNRKMLNRALYHDNLLYTYKGYVRNAQMRCHYMCCAEQRCCAEVPECA